MGASSIARRAAEQADKRTLTDAQRLELGIGPGLATKVAGDFAMNTVEELIDRVLEYCWKHHYDPREREFHRDKTALMKCVARYGHLCKARGWMIEPQFIAGEIIRVLRKAREKKADIRYLPSYLEGALTRAFGERAEEISAEALTTKRTIATIVKDAEKNTVSAVLKPTAVEVLDTLYRNMKKPKVKTEKQVQKDLL